MTNTGRLMAVLAFSSFLPGCVGTQTVGAAVEEADTSVAAGSDASAINEEAVVQVAVNSGRFGNDEVICRREQVAGTHMRRKICWTRAQRAAIREESQELYREMKRSP